MGVALTKHIGLDAGHPALAHGRIFFGVPTSTSDSVPAATFLFPGRPDFLTVSAVGESDAFEVII